MAISITGFDGHTLNSTTAYRVGMPYGRAIPRQAGLGLLERRSSHPTFTGMTGQPWRFPLRISGVAGAGVTYAQFHENVSQWFAPTGSRQTRTLAATWHDGTAVQMDVLIESLELVADAGVIQSVEYIASCVAPLGIWEAQSEDSAASPATVTNDGNAPVYPRVELTTGTHVTRRACTVTGAGAGGGVIAYPVLFVLQSGNPINTSTSANPAVVNTRFAHGLSSGNQVVIAGHDDAEINGTWTVTVTGAAQFTIPVDGSPDGNGSGGSWILSSSHEATFMGLVPGNFMAYVNGVPARIYVVNDGVLTLLWVLVDTASNGSLATDVDILYGSGISNPLANTLSDGGMGWAHWITTTTTGFTAQSSNTRWAWDDFSTVSSNGLRAGVWRPALTGSHNETANASYAITSESASSLVISLGAAGTYDNSADSIRLHVGAKAGTSSALTGLRRVTANLDGSNARAFVKKRVANSSAWTTVWSTTSNATVTSDIDIDDAVEIAVGLENHGTTADPATLTIEWSTDPVQLTLASTPTVVVGNAENFDFYDGDYTINGRTITFTDLCVPDGTLTIDAEARSITSSVDGPFYGPDEDDRQMFAWSDPDQWYVLDPGSNTVTDGLSATDTVKWRDGYSG
jgi:hypothetical protein